MKKTQEQKNEAGAEQTDTKKQMQSKIFMEGKK